MLHRPSLDLTRYHWQHQRGDLIIFGTWWGPTFADSEPCIAIVPAYRTHGIKPAVVCLSAAYKWNGEPRRAAHKAMEFCDGLGLEPTPSNALRIATIINDHLNDLISIPPMPTRESRVVADAFLRDSEGKEIQGEITERF